MFPLLETALAFAVLMLAASLFVSTLVQLVQKQGRYRCRSMSDMLAAILHGFRAYHNDPDVLATEREKNTDAAKRLRQEARNFANDILSDPALNARADQIAYEGDPDQLAKQVEYVGKKNLVDLIKNYAKYHASLPDSKQTDESRLPVSWVGATGEDASRGYATVENFAAYANKYFTTFEATASEFFKQRIRRLTAIVSCTVVVLFNLDGFRSIGSLYRSGSNRAALVQQTADLQATVARLGISGGDAPGNLEPDDTNKELALELQKTATILDEAQVGLGWQESWIVERWCAYRGLCEASVLPPSLGRLLIDTLGWLAGLSFSAVMLSLGAPFWVATVGAVIKLRNEVEAQK